VIHGSAITCNGRGDGILTPNGPAQRQAIQLALAAADLSADHVDAVEGHGTGTALGDAIEAGALLAGYGPHRERPLWLGSIKSNIAHCQAAAGVAGVIKMVLALQHGLLPRTLHVDRPVPHVDWAGGAVRLLTETVPWPESGRPRRGAVSGTGISGVNVHLVLEQAPVVPGGRPGGASISMPLVVSAATPAALRAQAGRLLADLRHRPDLHLPDVAYALATTRTAFTCRAAVAAADRDDVHTALAALADGSHTAGLISTPEAAAELPPGIATAVREYLRGKTVHWKSVVAFDDAHAVPLPTYPFQHQRFWLPDTH
jgi:acyl transferase domain-containing protein